MLSGNVQGFTLVEVLVALAIVSVALAASIRSVGLGISGVHGLQERSLALQAAENHLTEMRISGEFPIQGNRSRPCIQGSFAFICNEEVKASVNNNFRYITLRVRLADGPVLAELSGLLVRLQ